MVIFETNGVLYLQNSTFTVEAKVNAVRMKSYYNVCNIMITVIKDIEILQYGVGSNIINNL